MKTLQIPEDVDLTYIGLLTHYFSYSAVERFQARWMLTHTQIQSISRIKDDDGRSIMGLRPKRIDEEHGSYDLMVLTLFNQDVLAPEVWFPICD